MINDTHPKIQKILIEGYRRMTAGQKMQCVTELNHAISLVTYSQTVWSYI